MKHTHHFLAKLNLPSDVTHHPILRPPAGRCPFALNFRSDQWEVAMEAALGPTGNGGFELVYFMDAISCNFASL